MRFGSRVLVVILPSLFMAIACMSGENQCLNPQPDLPSCGPRNVAANNGGSSASAAAGSGTTTGATQNPSSTGSGGSGINLGVEPDAGTPTPNDAAGSSGDDLEEGAGGRSAGGTADNDAGAGGAAGSDASP